MKHRQDLVQKLEVMTPHHVMLFPHHQKLPRVTVQCRMRGGLRHWWVEKGLEETYRSSDVEAVVDHLLQLRPLGSYHSPMILVREETSLEDAFESGAGRSHH
ncbi:hypothetical protein C8P63_1565 [Melghirimyces profundicolus]|uniref:Uncharacterized protein n=1 Tax=Melghirimyces profundicolus TaxID=1242148 RepID=A0A2T6ASS7_9BACL|nr:hypothetical protein [Melghirimyces profundicolus]PTX46860.1 hypothetical protein C8P63_1565 [Melghirimyces profundicolus]